MAKPKFDRVLTEEFLRRQVGVLGKPTEQIGREVGCSGRLVREYARRFGVARPEWAKQGHYAALSESGRATRFALGHRIGPRFRPGERQGVQFQKGQPCPWKGHTKHTHPTLAKISASLTGKSLPHRRGPNHPNWKGGATDEARLARNGAEYRLWRDAVYRRDDYTCQDCGKRGGRLHAHHVEPFAVSVARRFDVTNGVTLCRGCHGKRHPSHRATWTPKERRPRGPFSEAHKAKLRTAKQTSPVWNKGKTRDSDPRIARAIEKSANTRKGKTR